jgi:hypothetical protein
MAVFINISPIICRIKWRAFLRRMKRYLSGKSIERKMYLSENVAVMYL